jgi:hypothetical protein
MAEGAVHKPSVHSRDPHVGHAPDARAGGRPASSGPGRRCARRLERRLQLQPGEPLLERCRGHGLPVPNGLQRAFLASQGRFLPVDRRSREIDTVVLIEEEVLDCLRNAFDRGKARAQPGNWRCSQRARMAANSASVSSVVPTVIRSLS